MYNERHKKKRCVLDSPGFSKFRELMDMADEQLYIDDCRGRVESMIDHGDYVILFRKGGEIFGGGEDTRVIFAKMKHPDEDLPKGWEEEASFSADNLNKKLKGEPAQHVFEKDDLKEIKVIDREDAIDELHKEAEKLGDDAFPKPKMHIVDLSKLFQQKDPDEAPNFVRADED